MPTVELPGVSIDSRQYGPADAERTVMFVHGFLATGELWTPVAERLAARGIGSYTPTWPLGAHRHPVADDADLSPRGVARMIVATLQQLGLRDVTLVGNDTGGAIAQFVLDELLALGDTSLVTSAVLTNCDAFEVFPPKRFKLMFRIGQHPLLARTLLAPTRWTPIRHSALGFGPLSSTPLDPELTWSWAEPALSDRAIRHDIARFLGNVRPEELAEVSAGLRRFDGPVRLVWGTADTAFTLDLAERLAAVLPNAEVVEVPGSRTFVSLDAPDRLADAIATVSDLGGVSSRRR